MFEPKEPNFPIADHKNRFWLQSVDWINGAKQLELPIVVDDRPRLMANQFHQKKNTDPKENLGDHK